MRGEYTASRAASVTRAELESKWESYVRKENIGGRDYSKFSIKPEDITRYTTVLQGLVDQIRESGAGNLWYNLEIADYRGWNPR